MEPPPPEADDPPHPLPCPAAAPAVHATIMYRSPPAREPVSRLWHLFKALACLLLTLVVSLVALVLTWAAVARFNDRVDPTFYHVATAAALAWAAVCAGVIATRNEFRFGT